MQNETRSKKEIAKIQTEMEAKSVQEVQEELISLVKNISNKSVLIWVYQFVLDIYKRKLQ